MINTAPRGRRVPPRPRRQIAKALVNGTWLGALAGGRYPMLFVSRWLTLSILTGGAAQSSDFDSIGGLLTATLLTLVTAAIYGFPIGAAIGGTVGLVIGALPRATYRDRDCPMTAISSRWRREGLPLV